jgi:hypothetical protein
LNPSAVTTLLKQISITTGAEVVFKSMCFEMHGLEHEVRAAVSMVMELDIIKVGQGHTLGKLMSHSVAEFPP